MSLVELVVLLAFEVFAFGLLAVKLLLVYKRFRFKPHLYFSLAFMLYIIIAVTRFFLSVAPPGDAGTAFLATTAINIMALLSALLAITFFTTIYLGTGHPLMLLSWFLAGASMFMVTRHEHVHLSTPATFWTYQLSTTGNVIVAMLVGVSTLTILLPVVVKLVRTKSKHTIRVQLSYQVAGVGLILAWGVMTLFMNDPIVQLVRFFLLPAGWLTWSVSLFKDPFNVLSSKARVHEIYLAMGSGVPLFGYSFEKEEVLSSRLISGLLTGINTALDHLMVFEEGEVKKELVQVIYKKKCLGIMSFPVFSLYVTGTGFDEILAIALAFMVKQLDDEHVLDGIIDKEIIFVPPPVKERIQALITGVLSRVTAI